MSVRPEENRIEAIQKRLEEQGASAEVGLAFEGISSLLLDVLNELRDLKDAIHQQSSTP